MTPQEQHISSRRILREREEQAAAARESAAAKPLPTAAALEAAAAQLASGRLLAPKDVAAMLGVGVRTLERWRGSGEGPAFLAISRATIRYTERAVAEFVAGRTMQNTAQG